MVILDARKILLLMMMMMMTHGCFELSEKCEVPTFEDGAVVPETARGATGRCTDGVMVGWGLRP